MQKKTGFSVFFLCTTHFFHIIHVTIFYEYPAHSREKEINMKEKILAMRRKKYGLVLAVASFILACFLIGIFVMNNHYTAGDFGRILGPTVLAEVICFMVDNQEEHV